MWEVLHRSRTDTESIVELVVAEQRQEKSWFGVTKKLLIVARSLAGIGHSRACFSAGGRRILWWCWNGEHAKGVEEPKKH